MIAHELKQPMGSVINYMTVLKIKLADTMTNDTIVSRAVAGAEEETRRMAAIVDRVRGYARRDVDRSNPVDLDEAVAKAFAHYSRHAAGSSRLTLSKLPPARILGNDLELELLVINLMKNADQAACDETGPVRQEKPEVTVSLSLEADDAGGPDMAELVVRGQRPRHLRRGLRAHEARERQRQGGRPGARPRHRAQHRRRARRAPLHRPPLPLRPQGERRLPDDRARSPEARALTAP